MKKFFTIIVLALMVISCTTSKESYKFLDDEHKTFFINGISALDGYSAVIKSLEELDFSLEEISECDLTYVNQGLTYYTRLTTNHQFTRAEFDKLTNGLFIDLPSKNFILNEVNTNGCSVFLEWYPSGIVKQAVIQVSRSSIEEDAIEINKRLSALFPHSKVGNKAYGYMTYYTDYGVEVYYVNDYYLRIEKK